MFVFSRPPQLINFGENVMPAPNHLSYISYNMHYCVDVRNSYTQLLVLCRWTTLAVHHMRALCVLYFTETPTL